MRLIDRCPCKQPMPKPKELEEKVFYSCSCGRVFVCKKHRIDEYLYLDPVMETAVYLKRRGHKVINV